MGKNKIITFLNHSKRRKGEDVAMAKNFLSYWEDLVRRSTHLQLKKGQKLFYEGHVPCGVFVIVSGKVSLFKDGKQGEGPVGQLAANQPIGIDLLANEQPYPFTAIADDDDVEAYFVSKSDLSKGK